MDIKNRPDDFQPFSKVKIGTNIFSNTQALVTLGGFAPLLIGQGDVPRVWLSVPPAQPGGDWLALVADNASSLPDLTVSIHTRMITVAKDKAVLFNFVITEEGGLHFYKFDLRPLGLNIFLDDKCLHVLDSTLTQSEMSGMPVVLALP